MPTHPFKKIPGPRHGFDPPNTTETIVAPGGNVTLMKQTAACERCCHSCEIAKLVDTEGFALTEGGGHTVNGCHDVGRDPLRVSEGVPGVWSLWEIVCSTGHVRNAFLKRIMNNGYVRCMRMPKSKHRVKSSWEWVLRPSLACERSRPHVTITRIICSGVTRRGGTSCTFDIPLAETRCCAVSSWRHREALSAVAELTLHTVSCGLFCASLNRRSVSCVQNSGCWRGLA